MSLLDRARAKRAEVVGHDAERVAARDRRERLSLVPVARRILELDEGRITCDDLTPVYADRVGERCLYAFTLEGHKFIVGHYWRDGSDGSLLAVQTKTMRGKPEWPPPHPASAWNTRWAPAGYVPIYALWHLAGALEGAGS